MDDVRQFLDISAREAPSDEESQSNEGDKGGMLVVPVLIKWLTLHSS